VHPSLPVKSIAELTALARKNPGKLGFGEGSASSRASVEMYKEMAGIDFLRVPYKSNPQAVTDLVSGQVVLMIADMVTLLPQVKAGKLRALAVSTPARLAILPDLPTMNEAGVKGYELTVWFAGFMPSGSPADAIRRMAELFGGATKTTKMQEFFVNFGGSAQSSSPEELSRFVASETAKWARIVKNAGIVPE
jgi:tripartite-type tricarboxylate transporter receptor subunit TctC